MLDGIKVLIERMDSHPEEFFGDLSYRWAEVMQDIAKNGPQFLEEEDLMLLNKKVKEVRRKELNAKIMDEIANAERLQSAQEKFAKAGRLQPGQLSSYGQAVTKPPGVPVQNSWWLSSGAQQTLNQAFDSAYNDYRTEHGTNALGNLEWVEERADQVTLNRIRLQNTMLEMELAAVKREQEAKDNRSKAYKQRNNQKWFNR